MKLENKVPNYSALVVKIESVKDLPKLDELKGISFEGLPNVMVLSKTATIGEIGIYFPPECQLLGDLCHHNNLYTHPEHNKDITIKGYVESNRRVKAIKLKGNVSSGLFLPLSCLDFLNLDSTLSQGDSFTHINDIEICKKYRIHRTEGKVGNKKKALRKFVRITTKTFPEHWDTENYFRNIDKFQNWDWITVTQKLHGCVEANTIIQTNIGEKTIKEIVDNRLDCQILAMDVITNEVKFVKIDDYYFKENDGDWYEIELEDGSIIKITGNNPVWLPELNCYRNAEDLSVGDTLLSIK
jgi:hypothetical protein